MLLLVNVKKMIHNLKNLKVKFILFGTFLAFFPPAVHAYAGPGVAIAAVIVFITVIFTFFASTLISLINLIKKVVSKISNLFKQKKGKARKNKQI